MKCLDSLENYLVRKIQPEFQKRLKIVDYYGETDVEPIKNTIILILLSMRASLLSILRGKDVESHALILETYRKQFENLKSYFVINKTIYHFFDSMNKIIDCLSEDLKFRGYNKYITIGKPLQPVKISSFFLVKGTEINYKEILIFALYRISLFLSLNWFTECQKPGGEIDEELKKKYYSFITERQKQQTL